MALFFVATCGKDRLDTYHTLCTDDFDCDPELRCLPYVPPGEDDAIQICSRTCPVPWVESDPNCPSPSPNGWCGVDADCVDDGFGNGICERPMCD